jgi:BMFP domain-containing protein YqiC
MNEFDQLKEEIARLRDKQSQLETKVMNLELKLQAEEISDYEIGFHRYGYQS